MLRERATMYIAYLIKKKTYSIHRLSQWPRGLRRRSAAARLLKSWVRNPQGT